MARKRPKYGYVPPLNNLRNSYPFMDEELFVYLCAPPPDDSLIPIGNDGKPQPGITNRSTYLSQVRYYLESLLTLPLTSQRPMVSPIYNAWNGMNVTHATRQAKGMRHWLGIDIQSETASFNYLQDCVFVQPFSPTEPLIEQLTRFGAWAIERRVWRGQDEYAPLDYVMATTPADELLLDYQEQAAFLAYLLRQRGVKLAGLLSYLFSWAHTYGDTLNTLYTRCYAADMKFTHKVNEANRVRLSAMRESCQYHITLLAKAVVKRIETGDPRWDKTVKQLGMEYIEILKNMLNTFEDVIEALGGNYEATMYRPNGSSYSDRPTDALPDHKEYATAFYKDVQTLIGQMEAGTFLPHWVGAWQAAQSTPKTKAAA